MQLLLKILGVSLVVLFCLAFFAFLPELFVIIAFLALPFLAMRSNNRKWVVAASLAAAVGLSLHFFGYKLFGSARVVKTPPLQNARVLASLEPPNVLRFADGGSMTLSDLYFPSRVNFEGISKEIQPPQNDIRIVNLLHNLGRAQERDLGIAVQDDGVGHAVTMQRQRYWCGNTFFPTILPARLPSHKPVDFGLQLVASGMALPSDQAGEDRNYRRDLTAAISQSQSGPWYITAARVPKGDARAIALGRSLTVRGSPDFVTGTYLLLAAQDTESYPALGKELRSREAMTEYESGSPYAVRMEDVDDLIPWLDVQYAHRYSQRASYSYSYGTPDWHTAASALASHGDLQGFDAAFQRMVEPVSIGDERKRLEANLKYTFHWPENAPYFAEWYSTVRPRLQSGRDEFGEIAFWLDRGKAFDAAYFGSMPKPIQNP